MNEVRVNRKAAGRVASGHPWIFSSDITDRDGAQPGAAVKVADSNGRPLGTAHYSSSSQIALRMLSRQVEEIGHDFYLARLRAAEQHRRTILSGSGTDDRLSSSVCPLTDNSRVTDDTNRSSVPLPNTNAYRVVHG